MSKNQKKNSSVSRIAGITFVSFSLVVSAFILSSGTAQAGFIDDWACKFFGECGGANTAPASQPQPSQPQSQPESTASGGSQNDDNSYGCVSSNLCQSGGGTIVGSCGSELQCQYPPPERPICNFDGKCTGEEDYDNCSNDCKDPNPGPPDPVLAEGCGCTSDGYVKVCSGYIPNPCQNIAPEGCWGSSWDRCGSEPPPFGPGVDGTDGNGQGGTGGQNGDSGIFGPGGFFGPGGGAGGAGGAGSSRPQCSDGLDNDNDGKTDRADPGCNNPVYDPNDNSESNFKIKEIIPDFFNLNWFKFNFVNFFGTRSFA